MQQRERGENPRRLEKHDVLAVGVGVVVDAVVEFFRRLHLLRQELDDVNEDSDSPSGGPG